MSELDLIARARLHVERLQPSLKPGQSIYVAREAHAALFRWPNDAYLTGFDKAQDGFAFGGHPVKAAP